MKSLLQALGIVLVVFLLVQTHETARLRGVTVTCASAEAEQSGCISFGNLGGVNSDALAFWVSSFIDHGVALPQAVITKIKNQGKRRHG